MNKIIKIHPVKVEGYNSLDELINKINSKTKQDLFSILEGLKDQLKIDGEKDKNNEKTALAKHTKDVVNSIEIILDDEEYKIKQENLDLGWKIAKLRYDAMIYVIKRLDFDNNMVLSFMTKMFDISRKHMIGEFETNPEIINN